MPSSLPGNFALIANSLDALQRNVVQGFFVRRVIGSPSDRMLKSSQAEVFGTTSSLSASRKLYVLVFLGVFVFQLVRVFIVIEGCAHHRSTGYTLQHCKDAMDGIVRSSVLAVVIPPAVPLPTPEPQWGNSPQRLDMREDAPLSPFFQPPRKSA